MGNSFRDRIAQIVSPILFILVWETVARFNWMARAFANDPEILLMDEPFASLDEQNKTLLQDELLRIWEETKKTVVFITHSIDEAISLGDRVVVMTNRPGRIKSIIPIRFARPRKMMELRKEAEYGELVYRVWQLLYEEVISSKA